MLRRRPVSSSLRRSLTRHIRTFRSSGRSELRVGFSSSLCRRLQGMRWLEAMTFTRDQSWSGREASLLASNDVLQLSSPTQKPNL